MNTNLNVKVDVAEDVKTLASKYSDIQKEKLEYQKNAATEDKNELCFRICTASGTRINVPESILRDFMIAGGIVATAKIVCDIICVISKLKK